MNEHRSHYLKYAKNIFSQNGEDGVIQQLFTDLNISGGVICEFGGWDGIWLSNIANLYLNDEKYQAILIESDTARHKESVELLKNYDNVECVNCFVSYEKDSEACLDNLFKLSEFNLSPDNFSLLSIDIDSADYYVFESLENYSPKVIIIETGAQSITEGCDYEFETYDKGCSLKSVKTLAEKKGYTLVCHTGNAFFVRNDLVDNLPNKDYTIENLYLPFEEIVSYAAATGPDGSVGRYNTASGDVYFTSPKYHQNIRTVKQRLQNGETLYGNN